MRVDVLYFGVLRDIFGTGQESVDIAEDGDVAGLLELLRRRVADPVPVWKSLAVAVNREYAGRGIALRDGDEVALLPPVSGGAG